MPTVFTKRIVSSLVLAFGLSAGAYAAPPYIDITSDIGTLDPIALGEDLTLSPCGSAITNTSGSFQKGICTTGHPDFFSINYLVSFGGTTSALTFGSGGTGVASSIASLVASTGGTVQSLGSAAAGLATANIATGIGTLFSTAGTYVISMITAVDDGVVLTADNGRPGADGGLEIAGSGFTINGVSVGNFNGTDIGTLGVISGGNPRAGNGRRNVAFSQTTLVVNEAVTVPEPSSVATLAMALTMVGGARRRRQRNS